MIKINFEDTIVPLYVSSDFTEFRFISNLKDRTSIELQVQITKHPDVFLPEVYNLAFGPLGLDGQIDDSIRLHHDNKNKVFSTIILFAIIFLQENKDKSIGIDGSNDTRAYLYHRMFESNYEELSEFLITIGVDWYVKLLRCNDVERDEEGNPLFKPRPEPFDIERKSSNLYRYYIFSLNQ